MFELRKLAKRIYEIQQRAEWRGHKETRWDLPNIYTTTSPKVVLGDYKMRVTITTCLGWLSRVDIEVWESDGGDYGNWYVKYPGGTYTS
tara:strand:+ start:1360 stop:1626 length:267 start_codon:yes stop_codon:yes gene_type:complete